MAFSELKLGKAVPLGVAVLALLVALVARPHPVPRVHAAAEVLYGVASDDTNCSGNPGLFTINTSTAAPSSVGCLGLTGLFNVDAIDFNPSSGVLYGTGLLPNATQGTDVVLITINPGTGAATLVGATGLQTGNGGNITDLSFRNSDNVLYGHRRIRGTNANELYTINTSTGVATLKGLTGLDTAGNGIAFSPTDTLYLIGDDSELYTLNQSTGANTDTGTGLDYTSVPTTCSGNDSNTIGAMDYQPSSGTLFGIVGGTGETNSTDSCLVTVNTTSGVISAIGVTQQRTQAIAFQPSAVGTPTPTPTNTTGPSSTPTRTPTATPAVTSTAVKTNQPSRGGGAAAAAAILGAIEAQRRNQPTAVAGSSSAPTTVLPPNTGDAGLKSR